MIEKFKIRDPGFLLKNLQENFKTLSKHKEGQNKDKKKF